MKKWISTLMMVAMVVTTIMPAASHASMNHQPSATATHSKMAGMDCDHSADKASHDKHASKEKPCCDKGSCQCIGGTCHGGLATITGPEGYSQIVFNTSTSQFAFAQEPIELATLSRLKRPPRAQSFDA